MKCHDNPLREEESARIWRAEDIGDLELLHARYIDYSFARHTHEGAAIGVIEQGAESFYYRGAMHTAPTGTIVAFNPSEVHTGQGADKRGWRFRMFYMDSDLLRMAATQLTDRSRDIPFFPEPTIQDPELASMLLNLHVALEQASSALERKSRFIWTFARMAQRYADDPGTERPIGREKAVVQVVRRYLEDHFTENVTLDQLASLSGLSAFHLIRVFRAEVGLPPHAYLEQFRVNRGRHFLQRGISISEAALLTGFTDQSHFSRHFKKMTGVTPGQYRRLVSI